MHSADTRARTGTRANSRAVPDYDVTPTHNLSSTQPPRRTCTQNHGQLRMLARALLGFSPRLSSTKLFGRCFTTPAATMSVHRISDANGQAGHDTATSTRAVQQHRVNRLRNLDHVVLRTAHLPKLVAFYCDILGATVEREAPSIGMVQLRTGSSLLDVLDAAGSLGKLGGAAPGAEGHNMDHLCLALDDFDADALRTHLEKHGVEASPTLARYGADGDGPSVYVKDPDGNTVELKGYPPASD